MRFAKPTFLASQRRDQLGVCHALECIISLRDPVESQLHYIDATREREGSRFNLLAAIGTRPQVALAPLPAGSPVSPDLFRFDTTSEGPAKATFFPWTVTVRYARTPPFPCLSSGGPQPPPIPAEPQA